MNQDETGGLLKYSNTKDHWPHPSCSAILFSLQLHWDIPGRHGNPVETFISQQYLHLSFPFEEIEWSQDDPLRLVHISAPMPFSQQNELPVSDVEHEISIWKEIN